MIRIGFRLMSLILPLVIAKSVFAYEGLDRQSPEEIKAAKLRIESEFRSAVDPRDLSELERNQILSGYQHLDPKREVPSDLLKEAVLYFDKNKNRFPNKSNLAVIDFKPRSDKYRFFVVNLITGKVEKFRTTHGEGSDVDDDGVAERFLNVVNSQASSLGFIRTAEVYSGAFKRSLRLDGLSSTNSKVRERAIVIHGWDYVVEAPVKQSRSWGCAALDWRVKDWVIDQIKEGALLYIGVSQVSGNRDFH